jgi:hypothetical protein
VEVSNVQPAESCPAPPLALGSESPPVKRTRAGYLHPLIDGCPYEATYSRKVRVIKGWRADGAACTPPDLPPLDDPEAMVDWWQRVKVNTVPTALLTARADAISRRTPAAPTAPALAALPPAGPAVAQARATITDFESVEALDLPSAILRQQRVLSVLQRDYEHAICSPATDESTLTLRAGRVDKCLERLHQLQKTLTESQLKNGDLLPRGAVRDELAPLFENLAGSLITDLADRFGIDRARATEFVDNWFRHLRESRLCTETLPAPAAAAA